jgi:hypothetical protein
VRALSNAEVANYLNQHFVCSFQKVGNFRIVNGQKVGGNVASYFTLDDGKVLDIVAGPADASTLLREARWVVETRKLAIMTSHGNNDKYRASWRKAHADRLQAEHGMAMNFKKRVPGIAGYQAVNWWDHGLTAQARVHLLLTNNPLVRIDKIYRAVFENILREKTSTLPIAGEVASQSNDQSPGASIAFRASEATNDVLNDIPVMDAPERTAENGKAVNEQKASRRLKLARMLADDAKNLKNPVHDRSDARDPDRLMELACDHFREIAKDYPNTNAAKEARRLLGEE